jgi:hypothetical protein
MRISEPIGIRRASRRCWALTLQRLHYLSGVFFGGMSSIIGTSSDISCGSTSGFGGGYSALAFLARSAWQAPLRDAAFRTDGSKSTLERKNAPNDCPAREYSIPQWRFVIVVHLAVARPVRPIPIGRAAIFRRAL